MRGVREQLLGGANFAQPDHRHMPATLFARQRIENLGLDGHVKRGGRFVGDQRRSVAISR